MDTVVRKLLCFFEILKTGYNEPYAEIPNVLHEPVTYLCSGQYLALQTLSSSLSNNQTTLDQNEVENHNVQIRFATDNGLQILFTNN